MVWPFSSSSSSSPTPEVPAPAAPQQKQPQFLEDLPPKFEDHTTLPAGGVPGASASGSAEGGLLTNAVRSIQPSDFGKLHEMPCFREAILTGGAVGGVVFAVMITTRSAVPRAFNWAVGGLLVGSIVSWEQCRFKLRQEKKNQLMAREMYRRQNGGGSGPVPPPPSA
jgi:cytochrome c oxidase assembly protein subunit 20